jgi:hypothetical protein
MNGTGVLIFRGQWSDHYRPAQHGYKQREPLSTFISISPLEESCRRVFGSEDLAVEPQVFS